MRTPPRTGRPLLRWHATLVLVVLLVSALTWASLASVKQLRAGAVLGYEAALGAATAGVCWLVVLWFAGCLLVTLLARLPGLVGRRAARLARLITPRLVRQLLEAGLGTALLVGGSATPAHAGAAEPPVGTANGSEVAGRPGTLPHPDRLPRPDRPATKPRQPEAGQVVVVRPGDTLWGIAAEALPGRPMPAQVAASWPRWHAANRAAIGPDPNLIHPGDRLRPPRP